MPDESRLVLVPAFAARRSGQKIVLTRKFISGVASYQARWPGPVEVVLEVEDGPDDNLDHVSLSPDELPFAVHIARLDDILAMERILSGASAALLAVHYRQLHLAELCNRLGVPGVYGAEYSLQTRLQILRSNVRNPLVRARRAIWEWNLERSIRQSVAAAAGMQCNGTPTWEAYRKLNPRTLLYFDTRVDASMLADDEALTRRFARRRASGVRRLAFSGRLIAMKGADHLVEIADSLRRRGVPYEFAICGAGELDAGMRREVQRRGLGDRVTFKGNLDFARDLVPFIRDEVDLFVCPHRQGDPSCTYLETMACGVPIIGYANEAWLGLVEHGRAGWVSPLDRPDALAERIAALSDDELERHSRLSLEFAREHTFESEFGARVDHLLGIIGERQRQVA